MNFDIKKEELKPIYDNRKSFYKKAYTEIISSWSETHAKIEKIKLYSYNLLVCEVNYCEDTRNRNYTICNEEFISQTTLRHIKEFLQQWFYCKEKTLTKKDILKNRMLEYNVLQDDFIN